jgi:hypothetical protein
MKPPPTRRVKVDRMYNFAVRQPTAPNVASMNWPKPGKLYAIVSTGGQNVQPNFSLSPRARAINWIQRNKNARAKPQTHFSLKTLATLINRGIASPRVKRKLIRRNASGAILPINPWNLTSVNSNYNLFMHPTIQGHAVKVGNINIVGAPKRGYITSLGGLRHVVVRPKKLTARRLTARS